MKKILKIFFALLIVLAIVGCKDDKPTDDGKIEVTYDTDGGIKIDSVRIEKGSVLTNDKVATKDGYEFVTWVCDGYEYIFDNPITESITLKAIWLRNYDEDTETVVYFDTIGGSYIAPQVVSIGETIEEPISPIKLGYAFKYWVDSYNNKRFLFTIPIEEETHLEAYYEAKKKITIKFDSDGGSSIEDMITYYGDKIGVLPKPTKDGYLFLGWYNNGSLVDEDFIPALPITLKAKYAEIGDGYKYVTFVDYDDREIEKQKVKMGEGAIAPSVERVGYTFTGWDKDFGFIYEDITVKAKYEINKYLVSFTDSSGKKFGEIEVEYLGSCKAPIVSDENGKLFCGWDKEFSVITSDLTVNAIWKTIDTIDDEGKINHTINLLNEKYDGLLKAQDETMEFLIGEETLGTRIVWNTSNNEAISPNTGVINKKYVSQEVTLTAKVYSGSTNKTVTFEYVVPRTTMDLGRGITAGYMFSNYPNINENTLQAFDIYFLAFATFNSNGEIRNLGDYGEQFVKDYAAKVHERGAYIIPSFRTTETFVAVATNEEARHNFVKNIVKMINDYDLDGVDFDWECPYNETESNGFYLLCKETYEAVKANNPKHLVTAALLLGALANDRFKLTKSIAYLDYVSMMSYEMHVHTKATHHAALYASNVGATPYCINNSYYELKNLTVPDEKIIIGAAFFGRQWTNSKGLGTSATYIDAALSYGTILNNYVNKQTDTLKRYWDDRCKAPYIYDSETGLFISYDDPESIACKADFVVSKKLGGMMCWQTGQDNGDLVQAFIDNKVKFETLKN